MKKIKLLIALLTAGILLVGCASTNSKTFENEFKTATEQLATTTSIKMKFDVTATHQDERITMNGDVIAKDLNGTPQFLANFNINESGTPESFQTFYKDSYLYMNMKDQKYKYYSETNVEGTMESIPTVLETFPDFIMPRIFDVRHPIVTDESAKEYELNFNVNGVKSLLSLVNSFSDTETPIDINDTHLNFDESKFKVGFDDNNNFKYLEMYIVTTEGDTLQMRVTLSDHNAINEIEFPTTEGYEELQHDQLENTDY